MDDRIERLKLAQQGKFLAFDLRLLNLHVAVVLQSKQDRIPQSEAQFAILYIVLQVLWWRQLVCPYTRGEHAAITLGGLRPRGQNRGQGDELNNSKAKELHPGTPSICAEIRQQ